MNKRSITLSAIIALAALSRLLPHPPNVTPIAAMALFAAVYLRDLKVAFLLPIAAMFSSNLAPCFPAYATVILKCRSFGWGSKKDRCPRRRIAHADRFFTRQRARDRLRSGRW